ncbi:LA2681 family HEPN domain-containing protein [Pseudomonas aeruginosa]|uniref:LA2681 family HEPN domain-containing protein n=1 Tax=Pseudomonas aeruginosa TaxID=287 RepID=UPI000AF36712|nr:LA2681 family HEPN domain-containing protein [Pseudomonas aeruginosa]SPY49412.1 Uncharacterised protein [Pseudomonas aeruginosa]SPY56891.1 Uncharacterised protein [Pseudomonas aeruginosa]
MDNKTEINAEYLHEKTAAMDCLCDLNDFDGIVKLCEDLDKYTHTSAFYRLHIYYTVGSGYSHVSERRGRSFDSKYSGLALLNFRKALAEVKAFARDSLREIPSDAMMAAYYDIRSRLLTNLANELDIQGRRLEALAYYDDAISSGNVNAVLSKASCIHKLAETVYDRSHAYYLYRESARLYREALCRIDEFHPIQKQGIADAPFYNDFLTWFESKEQQYGTDFPDLANLKGARPKSKKESDYLAWCAKNRLFVNELNGISTSEVVNHDVLELPAFSARINPLLTISEELAFHGHFDEMKSDYCYARYLAFSASSMSFFDEHFSNSTFEHVDTLDYEINNLKTNHLKSCFRISYSIFDKISFFLYHFFELDAVKNDRNADFRQIWFVDPKKNKTLKSIFENSRNDYFRALYFISHEIRQGGEKIPTDQDLSYWFDPDTQRLFKIRNAMEHRALKLSDSIGMQHMQDQDAEVEQHKIDLKHLQQEIKDSEHQLKSNSSNATELSNILDKLKRRESNLTEHLEEKDRLSKYFLILGVEEFESLTMKLLTLAKDALVYLSLAVHYEESMKPQTELTIPSVVPKK